MKKTRKHEKILTIKDIYLYIPLETQKHDKPKFFSILYIHMYILCAYIRIRRKIENNLDLFGYLFGKYIYIFSTTKKYTLI